MNWGAIGAVADLLASCGVIASLVFLAIQIRNNSKVTRLSLRESYITGHNQIFERIMENPDVYRLWRLGTASPDEMNDDEQERFGILLYSIFNQFLIAFQSSQIDSSMGGNYLVQLDRCARMPGVQRWWSRQGKYFDPAFAALIEQRIQTARSSTPSESG